MGHQVEVATFVRVVQVDGRRATWSRRASTLKIASTAPAAPNRWPVIDLVELIDSAWACSPNTLFTAAISAMSPAGVEVPWALM